MKSVYQTVFVTLSVALGGVILLYIDGPSSIDKNNLKWVGFFMLCSLLGLYSLLVESAKAEMKHDGYRESDVNSLSGIEFFFSELRGKKTNKLTIIFSFFLYYVGFFTSIIYFVSSLKGH